MYSSTNSYGVAKLGDKGKSLIRAHDLSVGKDRCEYTKPIESENAQHEYVISGNQARENFLDFLPLAGNYGGLISCRQGLKIAGLFGLSWLVQQQFGWI